MSRRAVTLALLVAGCGCEGRAFTITRAGSTVAGGCAEVADTAAARAAGLSGRAPLDEGRALWLAFPMETDPCLTNGPVGFAIDAAWVASDGTVRAVETDFAAGDRALRCHDGAQHVIEWASANAPAVRVGDRVRW